jgi:hypothetical protein
LLQEPGSYIGEVAKAMAGAGSVGGGSAGGDKSKARVLVKTSTEGKYIVDIDKDIDLALCTPNTRVALRSDSYTLHRILPTKVDPCVSPRCAALDPRYCARGGARAPVPRRPRRPAPPQISAPQARLADEGGKGARRDVRHGGRAGQADHGDQGGHRAAHQAPRAV